MKDTDALAGREALGTGFGFSGPVSSQNFWVFVLCVPVTTEIWGGSGGIGVWFGHIEEGWGGPPLRCRRGSPPFSTPS